MTEKRANSEKNILGNMIKIAAMFFGFYQLSNLSIFTGKHFLQKV
jgi:hypothetical protein